MVEAKSKKDTLKARAKTAQTSRQIADMVQVISSFTPGLAMHSSAWLCSCSQGTCMHCNFLPRTPLVGSAAAHKKVADPQDVLSCHGVMHMLGAGKNTILYGRSVWSVLVSTKQKLWRLKLSGLMEDNAAAGPEHEQCGDGI